MSKPPIQIDTHLYDLSEAGHDQVVKATFDRYHIDLDIGPHRIALSIMDGALEVRGYVGPEGEDPAAIFAIDLTQNPEA